MKWFGALLIVAGTTSYGLILSFKKQGRLQRLKQFKETLVCLGGEIRVLKTPLPQALENVGNKSSYTYINIFYNFVAQNLKKHTFSGFMETWSCGIDEYVRDIYLTQADCDILKNVGNMPLHLDVSMQLSMLCETVSELEKLIDAAEKEIKQKCRLYRSAGVISGLILVLVLI